MASYNKLYRLIRFPLSTNLHRFTNSQNVNRFQKISTSVRLFEGNYELFLNPIAKMMLLETPIKMPALSPTMTSGTIVKWHKKEGDKVNAGDILCEVQTDKAIVAYEFDEDVVLAKILVEDSGKEISVGELIAVVCEEGDDWRNVKVPTTGDSTSETDTTVSKDLPKPSQKISIEQLKISPSARLLLDHYKIDVNQLSPTGPKGALIKEDVMNFISQNNLKPHNLSVIEKSVDPVMTKTTTKSQAEAIPATPYIDIELTSMRRTIAKRLTESKQSTPHAYMSIKCFMDEAIRLRAQLKNQSIPVSLNDLIVKAVGVALKQVPSMNCQWDNSRNTSQLLRNVDVSIAVATPTGLITPIIRNANRLTFEEINATSRDLINRAKDGKLQPDEFVGGSFSISNLGMYDIDNFTGVINPPQAGILAVGSTKKVFIGDADNYQLRSRMCMSLSYDAQAVDEETAALFLETLQSNLENPFKLLHTDGTTNRRLSALI